MKQSTKQLIKRGLTILLIIIVLALLWLGTTDNSSVWPYRNTAQYYAFKWWWGLVGFPHQGETGILSGTIRNEIGEPIETAWILVSQWDGKTHYTRTDKEGNYTIKNIPEGRYLPVVSAPGYQNQTIGKKWSRLTITANEETVTNVTMTLKKPRVVSKGQNLQLTNQSDVGCTSPIESKATRYQVTFDNAGQPNQQTLFYTPITATQSSLSLLFTIYPGPADTWECVSIPLVQAGYAVLATGPAYSLEIENDIDELQRLQQFAQQGLFPNTASDKMVLLGGSYSSLHVQGMLQRNPDDIAAAILLGPPTDMFEMRYLLEQGTFIPPFGLDQVLIALGFPDREPMHYWPYSGAYHIRPDYPPILLIHSANDEVVPIEQSIFLAENLDLLNVPYQMQLYQEASHYLLHPGEEGQEIYQITLDFLAKSLQ